MTFQISEAPPNSTPRIAITKVVTWRPVALTIPQRTTSTGNSQQPGSLHPDTLRTVDGPELVR
jgi:hypothetical protein